MKKQFVKYFITAGLIVIFSGISNYVLSQNTGGAVNWNTIILKAKRSGI